MKPDERIRIEKSSRASGPVGTAPAAISLLACRVTSAASAGTQAIATAG